MDQLLYSLPDPERIIHHRECRDKICQKLERLEIFSKALPITCQLAELNFRLTQTNAVLCNEEAAFRNSLPDLDKVNERIEDLTRQKRIFVNCIPEIEQKAQEYREYQQVLGDINDAVRDIDDDINKLRQYIENCNIILPLMQ